MNDPEFDILRSLVVRAFRSDVAREQITPDLTLFGGGLELDSFALVDLVMGIEKEFGVKFCEEDFTIENFANIRAISALIERSRSEN